MLSTATDAARIACVRDSRRRNAGHARQHPPPPRNRLPLLPLSLLERMHDHCSMNGGALECVLASNCLHIMRTNIVIDDNLMQATLQATGLRTKREAVEMGLRTLLRLRRQEAVRAYRGKLDWQGDLDAMRTDR